MTNQHQPTAFVTGAGRGIGRAIAHALARAGYQVALAARSEEEIHEAAREVEQSGAAALPLVCDVGEGTSVDQAIQAVDAKWGRLDLLVNNAGQATFGLFEELTLRDWEQTLNTNLLGAVRCIQAVLPLMKRQGGGRIINISSVSGLKGIEAQSAYCASKHALNGLSKTLAMELRPHNIAVHALCPGAVATRLAIDAMPDRDISDWMRPEEVADAVLYLASLPKGATVDILHLRRSASTPL